MIPPVSVHYWIPSTGWPVNLARPSRYRTGHRICDGCGLGRYRVIYEIKGDVVSIWHIARGKTSG